ncbi:MAG: hypothetical protein BWY69_00307 [Planctomycetes bacterium ADurb.Bin401]|nr:MAG: hypothetical protein BWY69_00307 [Planctomycetes bacterium ADurb.Bin401]
MNKLRLLIHLLVSSLNISWLLPLWLSAKFFFENMAWIEGRYISEEVLFSENYPFWPSISPFAVSLFYIQIAIAALAIIIFFWSFVLLCKIWPIKKRV